MFHKMCARWSVMKNCVTCDDTQICTDRSTLKVMSLACGSYQELREGLLANRRAAKYSLLLSAIVVVFSRPKFSALVEGKGKNSITGLDRP